MLLNWRINNSEIVSVCSLDNLASIDITAAKNIGVFCGASWENFWNCAVSEVKVWAGVWNCDRTGGIRGQKRRYLERSCESCLKAAISGTICGFLPRELYPKTRTIAPLQLLPFLLAAWIFYRCKLSCAEPGNFRLEGVELLVRLLWNGAAEHLSCARSFRRFYSQSAALTATLLDRSTCAIGIGYCKDLSDCSLSYKKWKFFSIVCQEFRKLCQFSLAIKPSSCFGGLNPEWEPRTRTLSARRGAVFCEYAGERLRRSLPESYQTVLDSPEFRLMPSV